MRPDNRLDRGSAALAPVGWTGREVGLVPTDGSRFSIRGDRSSCPHLTGYGKSRGPCGRAGRCATLNPVLRSGVSRSSVAFACSLAANRDRSGHPSSRAYPLAMKIQDRQQLLNRGRGRVSKSGAEPGGGKAYLSKGASLSSGSHNQHVRDSRPTTARSRSSAAAESLRKFLFRAKHHWAPTRSSARGRL